MFQSEGPRDMREILRRKLEEKMMMKVKEEERRKRFMREETVTFLERSDSRRPRSPRERNRGASITFPFPR